MRKHVCSCVAVSVSEPPAATYPLHSAPATAGRAIRPCFLIVHGRVAVAASDPAFDFPTCQCPNHSCVGWCVGRAPLIVVAVPHNLDLSPTMTCEPVNAAGCVTMTPTQPQNFWSNAVPKTKRMRRLAKKGLFVFLDLPKPRARSKKKTAVALPKETMAKLFYTKGDFSVTEVKRQKSEHSTEEPQPIDGSSLPSSSDGWCPVIPQGDGLYVAGVKVIRLSDGSCLKLYRVLVKPSVIKAQKKRLKRLKQRIERDDNKAARQRVRLTLLLLGKT